MFLPGTLPFFSDLIYSKASRTFAQIHGAVQSCDGGAGALAALCAHNRGLFDSSPLSPHVSALGRHHYDLGINQEETQRLQFVVATEVAEGCCSSF